MSILRAVSDQIQLSKAALGALPESHWISKSDHDALIKEKRSGVKGAAPPWISKGVTVLGVPVKAYEILVGREGK